jgi:hypothetical protein
MYSLVEKSSIWLAHIVIELCELLGNFRGYPSVPYDRDACAMRRPWRLKLKTICICSCRDVKHFPRHILCDTSSCLCFQRHNRRRPSASHRANHTIAVRLRASAVQTQSRPKHSIVIQAGPRHQAAAHRDVTRKWERRYPNCGPRSEAR